MISIMPTGKAGLCLLKPDYKQNQKKKKEKKKDFMLLLLRVLLSAYIRLKWNQRWYNRAKPVL